MSKFSILAVVLSLFIVGCEILDDSQPNDISDTFIPAINASGETVKSSLYTSGDPVLTDAEDINSEPDEPIQNAGTVSRTDGAVYQLAQRCVAIQSPATGKFLTKTSTITGDLFRFNNTSSGDAAHFYLKPAALGKFLLTDKSGKYLASLVPSTETTAGIPSLASEWEISASEPSANSFHFKLKNRYTLHPIQLEHWVQRSWLWGLIKTWELKREQNFKLVQQNDCLPYPEITVNVSGDRNALKGDVNAPVRGFIDAHTHITSNEFMGGKVVHGDPFHRWGVPYALRDSKYSHGPNGSLDLIGNIYAFGKLDFRYDTRGWPDFPWWPNTTQLTHTGYYYKWIERSWLSGQRMMVVYLVENEVLCRAQRTINPIATIGNECNEMESVRFQAKRLRQMQDYIDAQYGGPGKGFFRIVSSPEDARRVIADGKLAVVMGVEVSELFNCGELDGCSISKVEQGLNELFNMGIRSLYIAHKFDNLLSGAILEEGFINVGEALSTGHYYQTAECYADTGGKRMSAGLPFVGDLPFLSDLLAQAGVYPSYDQNIENHCNVRGLSSLGVYLVNRMIDQGMLIEIDHLSADAVTRVVDIAEARNYSGVISTHSYTHNARNGDLHVNFRRMLNLGGFASPYNSDATNMMSRVGRYLDAIESTPFVRGVGIGTDMGGLGGQAGPRGNAGSDPLLYPFTSEFGLTFDRQVSGNRTFDLNRNGLAHYGMVADHIQDMRIRSGKRVYEAVMNSAEAYLTMWERAAANSN